ncbi:hypothetical protein J3R82DRAFT_10770 [Butyriboletus roseoflavus]|nr:hypothetical protein J3R82DRAFT_10770 [Butyriboletus roseoflavus]
MLTKNCFLFSNNKGLNNKLAWVLTLVSNDSVTFQLAESVDEWTSFIPKGTQFEFNDNLWGVTTCHYLVPIQDLSDSQFDLVVGEAHHYIKTVRSILGSFNSGNEDFNDLFAFH